ncbi:hypothetical protein [Thiohalocapsa sp. ML1]|jgi:hypothetical protein|uniref:hypothetical protein n=1 Tax=Thiohalocapsa sp. ML1 TaxID=1431688 RepID=UPI0007321ED9|nr:hypothetical protein [Thiohalocapsa sp. ML1]
MAAALSANPSQAAIVALYDFDPNNRSGTTVDLDGSAQTTWTTSLLLDNATGTGAVTAGNQELANRDLLTGSTGNYLAFSANRESDTGRPTGSIGKSTWLTFSITPSAGVALDFVGQVATLDTYAFNNLPANVSSADWTLYYSLDGGAAWTSLSTFAGASANASAGTVGPTALSWLLTPLGLRSAAVDFLLDPVTTGAANGVTTQRSVGFDNLVVNANVTQVPVPAPLPL